MKIKLPKHKTKVVCTIGPASQSEAVLKDLIKSGMNVARLNFSHGTIKEHRENIRLIRSVAARLNCDIAILGDLPGPKIRIGKLQNEPVLLKKGDHIILTTKNIIGTASRIPVDFKKLPECVSPGNLIYLNDGFIQLKVQEVVGDKVRCKIVVGGPLLSKKGLSLPGMKISLDAVTTRDLDFIDFGLKENIDSLSVSFVENADDILKVKEFARKRGKPIYVVAKIEREAAIRNIDSILEVADAIMVARGDLGVDIPIENIPAVQKKLIYKANLMSRPVITATQMLESMTDNIRPTRAEVTDVANAILDGTDAVMLSEETTIGKYPVETVKMITKIATAIERQRSSIQLSWSLRGFLREKVVRVKATVEDVISLDVIEALRTLAVRLILTPTQSGSTPRRISRFKPHCWILAFCNNERVHNFLSLSYGVHPVLMNNRQQISQSEIMKCVKESGLAKRGDTVILTEGVSFVRAGHTNSLRIVTLI
jgi:pyruvate kinase